MRPHPVFLRFDLSTPSHYNHFMNIRLNSRSIWPIGFAALMLLLAIGLMTRYFEQLPIEGTSLGIDWHNIYNGIRGLTLTYTSEHDGLRNPPWSVLALIPLGLLSYRSGWGLMILIDIAVLIVSVPYSTRRARHWLAILLLISSYPSLRQVADGNVEALVIGGILLILFGLRKENPLLLAIGILLASAKFQETWLLLIVLGLYLLRDWRHWLLTVYTVALVVMLSLLWRGREWFDALHNLPQPGQGTLLDMSLVSVLGQHNSPYLLTGLVWIALVAVTMWIIAKDKSNLSRDKAGFLICASLMLAPYAAGNSLLTAFAIGVIPLLANFPAVGLVLIALTDVQYVLPTDFRYYWGNVYGLALVFIIWMILGWQIYRTKLLTDKATAMIEPLLAVQQDT